MKKILILLLLASLLITTGACTSAKSDSNDIIDSNQNFNGKVAFNGGIASSEGNGISIDGDFVTINEAGDYELKGTYEGQVIVDVKDNEAVRLFFNGVEISNKENSPIYIKNALSATIILMEGIENKLSDSSSFIEESTASEDIERINGAIYSKSDLIFDGIGSLKINSDNKSGILGKDSVTILDGNLEVVAGNNGIKCSEIMTVEDGKIIILAGKHGVSTKNSININGGELSITATKDGLNSENEILINEGTLSINVEDDGIHSDLSVEIADGIINIENSYEGIEGTGIVINGGIININATDDGINISGENAENSSARQKGSGETVLAGMGLVINNGEITISSGGDGLDSNGDIWIYGGSVTVNGPIESMNGSIDYNGDFTMDGGELIAAGSIGMVQSPSNTSSINSIVVGLKEAMPVGTVITLNDKDGKTIMSYTGTKTFQSIVFSSKLIEEGATYEIYVGNDLYGSVEVNGLISNVGDVGRENRIPGARPERGSRPDMGEKSGKMPSGEERLPEKDNAK